MNNIEGKKIELGSNRLVDLLLIRAGARGECESVKPLSHFSFGNSIKFWKIWQALEELDKISTI